MSWTSDKRSTGDFKQKKLLLQLEKRHALPTDNSSSMARLDAEIAAVEELISSYRLLFADEHL
jgi:hypothetical protein